MQIIAAVIAARHETRAYRRTKQKESIASVLANYEFALNVVFNMCRGAAPDKSSYGSVFAQISLSGSPEVKTIINTFIASTPNEKAKFDIETLIDAMKKHVDKLERNCK